jgi:WD40 repeat protein
MRLHSKNLRNALIGASAFAAVMSLGGCVADTTTSGTSQPGIPITCNGMELTEPQVETATPDTRSPTALAYGFEEDGASIRTPRNINQFGEFDGKQHALDASGAHVNFQQHTFLNDGFDGDVAADPTGKWLVFTSTRHSTRPQLYLQRVDGNAVTQLTSDNADYAFPSFSPDGKQIAFSSTRAGNWDIYVMDVDGRNVVQVTNSPAHDLHPSFSPDGGRLVFSSIGQRSKGRCWRRRSDPIRP